MDIGRALESNRQRELIPRPIKFHRARQSTIKLPFDKFIAVNGKQQIDLAIAASEKKKKKIKNKEKKQSGGVECDEEDEDDGFIRPTKWLFKPKKILLLFSDTKMLCGRVGSGLRNLGNTCYLNSILQALIYTQPLVNYTSIAFSSPSASSGKGRFDILRQLHLLKRHTVKNGPKRACTPGKIVCHLQTLNRRFRVGRQQDAHELLRYLMEDLQNMDLKRTGVDRNRLGHAEKHTTAIHQIFGGYLASQVKCHVCGHISNTFDAFLDISLQLTQASSIVKALRNFTRAEVLDGGNVYKCSRCKKNVAASKQFRIYRPPGVLCLHLKRFRFTAFGHQAKINKHVRFPANGLSLQPYMYHGKISPKYSLTAMIVHHGASAHVGHYTAFVKTSTGVWYLMDDSCVTRVSEATVLKQDAYMLIYTKVPALAASAAPSSLSSLSPPLSAKKHRQGLQAAIQEDGNRQIKNNNNNNNNKAEELKSQQQYQIGNPNKQRQQQKQQQQQQRDMGFAISREKVHQMLKNFKKSRDEQKTKTTKKKKKKKKRKRESHINGLQNNLHTAHTDDYEKGYLNDNANIEGGAAEEERKKKNTSNNNNNNNNNKKKKSSSDVEKTIRTPLSNQENGVTRRIRRPLSAPPPNSKTASRAAVQPASSISLSSSPLMMMKKKKKKKKKNGDKSSPPSATKSSSSSRKRSRSSLTPSGPKASRLRQIYANVCPRFTNRISSTRMRRSPSSSSYSSPSSRLQQKQQELTDPEFNSSSVVSPLSHLRRVRDKDDDGDYKKTKPTLTSSVVSTPNNGQRGKSLFSPSSSSSSPPARAPAVGGGGADNTTMMTVEKVLFKNRGQRQQTAGVNGVGHWDSASAKRAKKRQKRISSRSFSTSPVAKRKDSWDAELDAGRIPKIKQKFKRFNSKSNPFTAAYQQQQQR